VNSICIIPARGGSKGVPRKNLAEVGGVPLVVRACRTARASRVTLTVVSTDDDEIAAAVQGEGVTVHRRSPETATDEASSESCLLEVLREMDGRFDAVVLLQCTAPLTTPDDINGCLDRLAGGYDSAFCGCRFHGFQWESTVLGAKPIGHPADSRPRRQELRPRYLEAGSVYAMRTGRFLKERYRFFGAVGVCEVPARRVLEIDTPDDLQRACRMCPVDPPSGSTLYVDIDGTICQTEGTDYREARPLYDRITRFNRLHAAGCKVIYWTARGTLTGRNWDRLTRKQLARWGVQYDGLRFGKPAFDRFYDDKAEAP